MCPNLENGLPESIVQFSVGSNSIMLYSVVVFPPFFSGRNVGSICNNALEVTGKELFFVFREKTRCACLS